MKQYFKTQTVFNPFKESTFFLCKIKLIFRFA